MTNRLISANLKLTEIVLIAVEGLTHPFEKHFAKYERTSIKGRNKQDAFGFVEL